MHVRGRVDAFYERMVRVWYHTVGEATCGAGHCGKCESGMDVDAVGVVRQSLKVSVDIVGLGVGTVDRWNSLERRGKQLVYPC